MALYGPQEHTSWASTCFLSPVLTRAGFLVAVRPQTQTGPSDASLFSDINQAAAKTTSKYHKHPPALGGNTSYEYQHRRGYSKVMDPGMALSSVIGHSGPSRRSDLECGLFCIFGLPHLRSQLGWSLGGAIFGEGGRRFHLFKSRMLHTVLETTLGNGMTLHRP